MRAMFGIGPLELFALAAVALVVLGPRRLPELARQLGGFMGEIRRTTYELRSTLDAELMSEDRDRRREEAEERRRKFREAREQAKESGEWPPGGQQDTTDRPQPTVEDLSAPPSAPPSDEDEPTDPGRAEAAPPEASDEEPA